MKKSIQFASFLFAALILAACGSSESPAADTDGPSADEHAGKKGEHDEKESGHDEKESGHDEKESGHGGEEGHEEGHEEGTVKLTPEQLKAAGIAISEVGPASIRESMPLYGVITPNAERVLQVSARFPGVIRSVSVKVGDSVNQGDALAVIESNESLRSYPVTAPLSGVITERSANAGEQAGEKSLFTVADLSSVWVELSLFPRDVAKVQVGQKVRVVGADIPTPGAGTVVYVAPFGSAANQTQSARVLLDNADRRWAPGLYVTAEVTLSESSVPLAILSNSLQDLEGRSVVFVQDEDGFEPHTVTLGRSDGERTEVLSGLKAGDRYAAANSFILKAELGKGSAEHGH